MKKESTRKAGMEGENLVAKYLILRGWDILERNFYIRGGEIDIIALDGISGGDFNRAIVFIEVKFRTTDEFGEGVEQFGRLKRKRIKTASLHFLQKHGAAHPFKRVRYDFITLSPGKFGKLNLKHYKNVEL